MSFFRYADYGYLGILALAGAGVAAAARRGQFKGAGKAGARLMLAAWLLLLLAGWSPFATAMMGLLEWQAGDRTASPGDVQAMVVLSGGVYHPLPREPEVVPGFGTYSRCRHAAWLYHQGWRMPVVATGGSSPLGANYAEVMADTLRKEGVPGELILLERKASSTHENAVFTARMLIPKGIRKILLVTEAYHMPRARGAFTKAGFEVYPAPCFYRTREFRGTWEDWLAPQLKSVRMVEDALHELIGLAIYKLQGAG